jgi:ribosomal protein S18 acetylase RimI-like enzyme
MFELVQATQADREYLLDLRKRTIVPHLEIAGQFLSDKEHAERLDHRYDCSYIIRLKCKRVGFVKYSLTILQLELMQIQVEPQYQNQGVGSAIIQKILDIGHDKIISLSVLKNNPALQLYKKKGFKTISEDQSEYHMQYRR